MHLVIYICKPVQRLKKQIKLLKGLLIDFLKSLLSKYRHTYSQTHT